MCFKACDALNALPGVKASAMSVDRLTVELNLNNPNINFDAIREHPLIQREGVKKIPGEQGTVRLDECGNTMHLGSFHADDMVTLITAAHNGAPV